MDYIFDKFNQFLDEENKEKAVLFVLDKLRNKEIELVNLYTKILTPALNEIKCKVEDKRICIWKEHVKTAIVRTIVECCYPYVIEKQKELNYSDKGTAVIICPPEEYHDLGARMVSDFFTICGCKAIFVGSNTPYDDFYNAIDAIRPDFVAISVSDYYNIVITKKIIEDIKQAISDPLKIIVGGNAFDVDSTKYKIVGADYYARTFEDILKIVGSEVKL